MREDGVNVAVIAFSNVAVPIMSFNSSFNATHIMRQLMFPDVLSSRWVRSYSCTVCNVCFAHCFPEAHDTTDTYTLYVLRSTADSYAQPAEAVPALLTGVRL